MLSRKLSWVTLASAGCSLQYDKLWQVKSNQSLSIAVYHLCPQCSFILILSSLCGWYTPRFSKYTYYRTLLTWIASALTVTRNLRWDQSGWCEVQEVQRDQQQLIRENDKLGRRTDRRPRWKDRRRRSWELSVQEERGWTAMMDKNRTQGWEVLQRKRGKMSLQRFESVERELVKKPVFHLEITLGIDERRHWLRVTSESMGLSVLLCACVTNKRWQVINFCSFNHDPRLTNMGRRTGGIDWGAPDYDTNYCSGSSTLFSYIRNISTVGRGRIFLSCSLELKKTEQITVNHVAYLNIDHLKSPKLSCYRDNLGV